MGILGTAVAKVMEIWKRNERSDKKKMVLHKIKFAAQLLAFCFRHQLISRRAVVTHTLVPRANKTHDKMAASLATSAVCARASAGAAPRRSTRQPSAGVNLNLRRGGASSLSASQVRGQRVQCRAVDLRHLIERLCEGEDLSEEETEASLDVRPLIPSTHTPPTTTPRLFLL